MNSKEKIKHDFTYHAPTPEKLPKYKSIRDHGGNLALLIDDLCCNGEEKTIALKKIREAVMWANASIAVN